MRRRDKIEHRRQSLGAAVGDGEASMMRTASWAHLSQIYTRGPATSFSTCAAVRLQNEQRSFLKNIG
jgi:hypothetical protein